MLGDNEKDGSVTPGDSVFTRLLGSSDVNFILHPNDLCQPLCLTHLCFSHLTFLFVTFC